MDIHVKRISLRIHMGLHNPVLDAGVTQCWMLAYAIIKILNVFEDTRFDFLKRVEFLSINEFDFHTTEE